MNGTQAAVADFSHLSQKCNNNVSFLFVFIFLIDCYCLNLTGTTATTILPRGISPSVCVFIMVYAHIEIEFYFCTDFEFKVSTYFVLLRPVLFVAPLVGLVLK